MRELHAGVRGLDLRARVAAPVREPKRIPRGAGSPHWHSVGLIAECPIDVGDAQDQQFFNCFSIPFDQTGSLLDFIILQRAHEMFALPLQVVFFHDLSRFQARL